MATVRVENHYFPEGYKFGMPAFGQVENFVDKEVDDSMIAEFRMLGFEFPEDGALVIELRPRTPEEVEEIKAQAEAAKAETGATVEEPAPVGPDASGAAPDAPPQADPPATTTGGGATE